MSLCFFCLLCIYDSSIRQTQSNYSVKSWNAEVQNCFLFSVILGSNILEGKEEIERKVKPKSRVSPNGAATGKKQSAKTTKAATKPKASKYFQSPVKKEEEEYDSEDDFDTATPAAPALAAKMEKDEGEEEDSEEDEGDWEEVEGLSTSVGSVREKVLCWRLNCQSINCHACCLWK